MVGNSITEVEKKTKLSTIFGLNDFKAVIINSH